MRINIIDKAIKNSLDLSSEELVRLLRFRKPTSRREPFKIVSPVLVICDDKHFECDVLDIKNLNRSPYENPMGYGEDVSDLDPGISSRRQVAEKTDEIEPFTLKIELPAPLFAALTGVREIFVLMRVQNIPVYVRTDAARVDYNKEGEAESKDPNAASKQPEKPALLVKIANVRPILDLLKAQITESAFYEVFIDGKSDEFYDAKADRLDEIVELIGIKRKVGEADIELRNRVIAYLKIRMAEMSQKIKDEDLQNMINETDKQQKIDKAIDDASKKRKKKNG